MKKKSFFLLVIALFLYNSGVAQQSETSISGFVVDKANKQPVEFATVRLIGLPDSVEIGTAITDRKGKFVFTGILPGNYLVKCSFIGFTRADLPVSITQQQKLNVGTIGISSLSKDLGEVTVTSRSSMLNTSIDRKVYNLSQDIMAQSGTAADVLKNIPSVEVDIDGNVSLRGSGDVMILINGRPSALMGRSRAEVLQQFPANTIERIEVITNPSAKYKPDGVAGIINIVLKKNIKSNLNVALTANAGNGSRLNGNINLNYKPGKLNLFANYGARKDRRLRFNNTDRVYLDSVGKPDNYYTENNESLSRPLSHFVSAGAEYELNEHDLFEISGNYYFRKLTREDVSKKQFYDKNHLPYSAFDRLRYDPEMEKEYEGAATWQHNFKKEDQELNMEFSASSSKDKEDNHFTNIYSFPVRYSSFDNTLLKQTDDQQQLTIDYTHPLSEDAKLEAGYSGSFTQIDMNFFGENYDTAQKRFTTDPNKTNHFKYKDAIHAFYGVYEQGFEKFGFMIGLRAEQVGLKGNLVTIDSLIDNSYFKLYPTLHLSYKMETGELQLNYSKRINRPDGDEINPFPEYRDPQHIQAGNPKLLPEIIHSVELGYKWQDKNFSLVPSLYYRYKRHGFTSVTIPFNDSVLLTTDQNLSKDQSAGLEIVFSAKANKIFSATLSSNFFYNKIDASDLGYSNEKSIVSMSASLNTSFSITPTTVFQANCNFRSARLTPQGRSYASFVLNSGFRQDLFKKKLSVILTVSDLLKSLRQKNELNTPYFKQSVKGRRDAQIFYLGISFRFGKVNKKPEEEKIEFDNNL